MSTAIIPMDKSATSACFTEAVTLDGSVFNLRFYWNTRAAAWFMDISDAVNNPILAGVRLVVSYPLLGQHPESTMPTGELLVYDPNPTTRQTEPGRNDFTDERGLQLLYVSNL